ncbi:asparagine synthase (glutamine-hydrolyzing) [Pontibacter burrus]|uniref:asparagine synthase (glutamine-hydrolyzing) n=1 Tax=Pontibacter burrus TaxID=2704466 RepID=A0A6B3LPE8_9BACT|nr:asparagine synthase (glutamine-hydrolyzing) [Pontibacter burrus]NEM97753.1 asparagine synthase (glutamine-hydrolyzing) [Pontibacter burrus]
MCGIAGSINCALDSADLEMINHRGPDAKGISKIYWCNNTVVLGHTRLAIVELSEAGNQPMVSECGRYYLIFNGEIYNHLELRKKLGGVTFKGNSDTETLLYFLIKYGITGVSDFNGIFSFAYLDTVLDKLYLVRDYFGVKPLYYYATTHQLIFSSEIKVIVSNECYSKLISLPALNTFLTFRYNPAPQTLFDGINKLEAATYLEYDCSGEINIHNYWPKKQVINYNINERDAIAEYKYLLEQAVNRQLMSDVPLGLLLSGGLDSAVLGHFMSKHSTYKVKSFTVGFEGKGNYNELDDARSTASIIQSEHYEVVMNKEQYLNYFYSSFYHTEEPIAEPTIPALLLVSQLASRHVKVVLSGQGADEPMAGYKRYKGEKLISQYHKLLSLIPLTYLSKILPNSSTIDRGIYSSGFKNEIDRFVAIYTLFTPDLKKKLYQDDLLDMIGQDQKLFFANHYAHADPTGSSLSKLLFIDTRSMLPDNLLLFNDKLTMANSIENRVPYLDIDLVNFIESLPEKFKLNGHTGKYIHRKAAQDFLPTQIINRKKRGFETPVHEWLRSELSATLLDIINSENSFSRTYFNRGFISKMVEQHRNNKKDYHKHLFILLSLELWYKNFYLTYNRDYSYTSLNVS